jgi:DNA polymerase-3 subunit epsilon
MHVLGLDFETTGIDPEKDLIIEVGAAVWDVSNKRPKALLSEMIAIDIPVPPLITQITGITDSDLQQWGVPVHDVLLRLKQMASMCDYVIAHNGTRFDQLFLNRYGQQNPLWVIDKPWIDTMTDLPYPHNIVTRKLSFLAAEHGFLNPFSHRAVFDVLTMLRVFSLYPLTDVLANLQSPLVKIMAKVSYEEKSKAKDLGFRWDPQNRFWYMEIRQRTWEKREFPFPTALL